MTKKQREAIENQIKKRGFAKIGEYEIIRYDGGYTYSLRNTETGNTVTVENRLSDIFDLFE